MLEIKNLKAEINNKKIIKGLNLKINQGEVHAIMGPNGSGKSTLSAVLAGDPTYRVDVEQMVLSGHDIKAMSPEQRAHTGLFIGYHVMPLIILII